MFNRAISEVLYYYYQYQNYKKWAQYLLVGIALFLLFKQTGQRMSNADFYPSSSNQASYTRSPTPPPSSKSGWSNHQCVRDLLLPVLPFSQLAISQNLPFNFGGVFKVIGLRREGHCDACCHDACKEEKRRVHCAVINELICQHSCTFYRGRAQWGCL